MSKSAKHVAAKIVSLLVGDYTARFEIEAVEDIAYGQRVRLRDIVAEESFVISVEKFNDVPPVEAKVVLNVQTREEAQADIDDEYAESAE